MAQRELTEAEVDALLGGQRVVRVAFHAGERGYLVPFGYVWLDGALHLVTRPGEKTGFADASPRVAFQVDDAGEAGMAAWRSVTGEGRWESVSDPALRGRVLAALARRFPESAEWARAEAMEKTAAGRLLVARVVPIWMTGRASGASAG